MNTIILDNGITYEWVGKEILDSTVRESVCHNELLEDHKWYRELLDFTETLLINPEQKYSSRLANWWLSRVDEMGLKKQRNFVFGPKKWMSQVEFWEKFTMSYLMSEWAKNGMGLVGASDTIQAEIASINEQAKDLVEWYDITYAEEMVKTLTKGFEITSTDWAWSACARDGEALFSEKHKLKDGTTFSNLIKTSVDYTDVEDWKAKLQSAIDMLKTMKFDNGKKVRQPKWEAYKLFCSRLRETYWLEVINNNSNKAGIWTNAEKENTFSFQNNLVQVVAIDLLWDLDVDGNTIWNDDMWFVSNPTAIKKLKAFKDAQLYTPKIKTWENNETDEISTSIRAIIWTWHYDAEFAIVWAK